jgi:hypothetical protein
VSGQACRHADETNRAARSLPVATLRSVAMRCGMSKQTLTEAGENPYLLPDRALIQVVTPPTVRA